MSASASTTATMTRGEREDLLAIIADERERATSPADGTFNYAAFAEAMKARATSAWESEHFCTQCGMPARFGNDVSIREGRAGGWRCLEHRL